MKSIRWIQNSYFKQTPFVCAFKRDFYVESPQLIKVCVSADERYQIYLDGKFIGAGSERGCRECWFYETYDLNLERGSHTLAAKVWALGDKAHSAQISVLPASFVLWPEDEDKKDLIATGWSKWVSKELKGFSYNPVNFAFGMRWRESIDGNDYDCSYRTGNGEGWKEVAEISENTFEKSKSIKLTPAALPPMKKNKIQIPPSITLNDLNAGDFDNSKYIKITKDVSDAAYKKTWQQVNKKEPVIIKPNKTIRVIFSLDNYYCIYPEIRLSKGKGSRIRINFAESAYLTCEHQENQHFRHPKGDRSQIIDKYFTYSMGTTFISSGKSEQLFDSLWWFSGLYIELLIETGSEELLIDNFDLYETRYPLEFEGYYKCSDERFNHILDVCFRTLQVCTHETYLDCPFYEQMMYVGDARIEALVNYVSSNDRKMPEKAIRIFNYSRLPNGLNMSCYPYRGTHVIPPFSLLWIAMVSDYAYWSGQPDELVCSSLKDARRVIDYFFSRKNCDGFISPADDCRHDAFNFIDWVDQWGNDWGVPRGENEINSVFHWLFIYILKLYSDLEENFGNKHYAKEAIAQAAVISNNVIEGFWDSSRGVFADDLKKTSFSEHSQIFALLSGRAPQDMLNSVRRNLFTDTELLKTTIYFSHYYFEVCSLFEKMDSFWSRMSYWYALQDKNFKTVYESTLPTRSDCHAWASHPLYHYYVSILGIRPVRYGFNYVEIKPQLGPLKYAKGNMVSDKGIIKVDLQMTPDGLKGQIVIPQNLEGILILPSGKKKINHGVNVL